MNEDKQNTPFVNTPPHQSQAAERFIRDFPEHLVPLEAGAKYPLLPDWPNYQGTPAGLAGEVSRGKNLGLKTARFPAFDIEDGPHADRIFEIVQGELGGAAPYRWRTGTTSRALLARLPDSEGEWVSHSIKGPDGKTIFEVLGRGRQLHVWGYRADAGEWLDWSPGTPAPETLPEVAVVDLSRIVEKVREYLVSRGVEVNLNRNAPARVSGVPRDLTCPRDELEFLVERIPNDERFAAREDWLRMGFALKGASSGEARDLWTKWCAQVPQNDDVEARWDSMGEVRDIGRGQLWKWALEKFPRAEVEWDFRDSVQDAEKKAPVNGFTGKERWLAKRVMRAACSEDNSVSASTQTTLTTWGDFAKEGATLSKPAPLIEGFAWPGVVHGVIAAPGVGKSLWSVHCVMAALLGVKPRDRTAGGQPQPHVFMLAGEDAQAIVWERAEAARVEFEAGGQASSPTSAFEYVLNRPLELVRLDEKTRRIERVITPGLHQLCDRIEALPPEDGRGLVVVLDMLRHSFFGSENERWQIDAVFRVWKAVMGEVEKTTGRKVGFVFVHHMTKASSRKMETGGFNSAGSIGIEGNARAITEMRAIGGVAGDFIELKLAKSNYGRTGTREFYRKKMVPSVFGGGEQTVVLEPVSERDALYGDEAVQAHQMGQAVEALHKWATQGGGQGKTISHGKRVSAGTVGVAEALREAGVEVFDPKDREDFVRAAEKSGAFLAHQRVRRGAGDTTTGFLPVLSWTVGPRGAAEDFGEE